MRARSNPKAGWCRAAVGGPDLWQQSGGVGVLSSMPGSPSRGMGGLSASHDAIHGIHTSSVRSFYWAEKAIREEQEVRTLLDSEVPFLELRRLVESVHPYELPMIVSAAHGGPLIAKRESLEKYLMGAVDVNETTAEEAEMIAKELVQIRYVACSHVEKLEDKEDTHRVTVKTTAGSRTHIVREFGGLDFEWTPLQGNRPFLQWVEAAAVPSSAEL
uniref:Uncharacterized protein n=1 Tax=Alexandrium monilatum TaxID=311494 RepID=A0A7S4UWE4_9DINO